MGGLGRWRAKRANSLPCRFAARSGATEGDIGHFTVAGMPIPQSCTCCSRRAGDPRAMPIRSFVSRQHAVSLSHDPAEGMRARFRWLSRMASICALPRPHCQRRRCPAVGRASAATALTSRPCWALPRGAAWRCAATLPIVLTLPRSAEGDIFPRSLVIAPGPHLAGGERSVPVPRAMLALAP